MMLRLTMVRRVAAPDEVAAEQLAQCALRLARGASGVAFVWRALGVGAHG